VKYADIPLDTKALAEQITNVLPVKFDEKLHLVGADLVRLSSCRSADCGGVPSTEMPTNISSLTPEVTAIEPVTHAASPRRDSAGDGTLTPTTTAASTALIARVVVFKFYLPIIQV
jgi:hypothetical protein